MSMITEQDVFDRFEQAREAHVAALDRLNANWFTKPEHNPLIHKALWEKCMKCAEISRSWERVCKQIDAGVPAIIAVLERE